MTWDNYGEWEIDHIVPISSGKTEEDVIKLCHYKNLQPLWKEDNRKKGNKLPDKTPSN
jgi:5-methylcytosine-specific restriction endonuclease McrA